MTRVPDNIDDLISAWHAAPDTETRPLHEYLGLTWEEYKAWGAGDVSKNGTILTAAVIAALVEEAQAGYDTGKLVPRRMT